MNKEYTSYDKLIMRRCFELARMGGKHVKSNPQVGAVIVHENRIIGEGYHASFGGPHAEVNAVNSISDSDAHLISKSTIYVSLEPCCFEGKTPACTNLIITHKIPNIIISNLDPNPMVSGKGIQILKNNGCTVSHGLLKDEGNLLIGPFKAALKDRPYITLKWAKSRDHFIAAEDKQVWLSNPYSSLLSHQLRSDYDAILVGNRTVLVDDPSLTTRHVYGDHPLRIVLDKDGKVSKHHKILSDEHQTILISEKIHHADVKTLVLDFNSSFMESMLSNLLQRGICRLIVEGGKKTLQSFLDGGYWDRALVINTPKMLTKGIKAPNVEGKLVSSFTLSDNRVLELFNPEHLKSDCP